MSSVKKYELSLKVLEYLSMQKNYVLRQNIIEQKSEGKKRDLLEIVTAHTSLTAKEAGHKCGAIAANFSEELKEGKKKRRI